MTNQSRPVTPRRSSSAGRRFLARCLVAAFTLGAFLVVPAAPAGSAPLPAGAQQLLTVETASASATTGTLRAWERTGGGGWRLALGPFPVYVGSSGVGSAREGSATTPAGTFPLTEAFGRQPNPGTTMPYFQSDTEDWWDGNTSSPTYNTHVRRSTSPGGASENLYLTGPVYDYAVNIGYNLDRVPGAGSAIFLHVADGRPTAGCVSMDRAQLISVLRWLRPDAQPHMMINVAPVRNAIADAWYRNAGAAGPLGLPVMGEAGTPDGRGVYTWFERGAVYWTARTGAHAMFNGILGLWARSGYERGPLGYPTTGEHPTPDGRGAFNWFEHGAAYWSIDTGTHSVVNGIAGAWARSGYETGPLGYPVTDEHATAGGRGVFGWFQGGAAYWSPASGAHWMAGPILERWVQQGYENGPLGFPVSDPYAVPGGTRVDFQGGSLTLDAATGAVS